LYHAIRTARFSWTSILSAHFVSLNDVARFLMNLRRALGSPAPLTSIATRDRPLQAHVAITLGASACDNLVSSTDWDSVWHDADATPLFQNMKRASSWILAAAVGVGVVARIWDLGRRSFWYDELYCVVGAAASTSIEQLRRGWIDVDGHPPGFMLALYAWFKVVPATEVTGRLPGCVVGILTIAGLLCAARGLRPTLPRSVAYYAAALYSLGTEPIYYAQTVRQYGFLMACSVGALIEWTRLYEDPSTNRTVWIRLTGWLLVAAYLHYLAMLLVAAILGIAFLRALFVKRGLKNVLVSGAAFCLAYVPGFFALKRTISWRIAGWQHGDSVSGVARELLVRGFFGPAFRTGVFVLVAVIVLSVMRRAGARDGMRPLVARSKFQAVALVLLVMVVEFAVLSRLGPFMQLRYVLVLYAPILLTMAWVMAELAPVEHVGGPILLSGILAMGVVAYRDYRQTGKQDWRASAERVIQQHSDGDNVFVMGADPTIAPDVYLRNGQVDDYFNCRTVPFYAFYFRRLGAPELAAELRSLPLQSDLLSAVLVDASARTSFVLAPHHMRIGDDALERLKGAGFEVDDTAMFSTHVYKIGRRD
jgi:hypothetical protein